MRRQLFCRGGNLYAYVDGNPLYWYDPYGLTKLDVNITGGVMTVDPEQQGRDPYKIPITSGRGECMNKPSCSDKGDTGPVPAGEYAVNVKDLTNPGTLGDIARNLRGDWGDWRVPLIPGPTTDTKGRSGFFLHGGKYSGSAGCIDFGGGIFGNKDTDRLLNDIKNDPDSVIPIHVH